jgi:hypothetical protein
MRLGLLVLGSTAAWSGVSAFLLPRAVPTARTFQKAVADGQDEKSQGLSWQESLELLIVPTTPLPQRQILLQVSGYGCRPRSFLYHFGGVLVTVLSSCLRLQNVLSRAPEIKKDVEDAIQNRNVDGLLTEGVKAVVRHDS